MLVLGSQHHIRPAEGLPGTHLWRAGRGAELIAPFSHDAGLPPKNGEERGKGWWRSLDSTPLRPSCLFSFWPQGDLSEGHLPREPYEAGLVNCVLLLCCSWLEYPVTGNVA